MTKRHLNNNVGCVPRTDYYLSVRGTHPTKTASHVGWVKPPIFISPFTNSPSPASAGEGKGRGWPRRTQQNHIVRRVSLRSTHPTFELSADVGCVPRTDYYLLVRGTHPTKNASNVGWVKPRKRRTQQNITIRQVLLRLTLPNIGSPGISPRSRSAQIRRGAQ